MQREVEFGVVAGALFEDVFDVFSGGDVFGGAARAGSEMGRRVVGILASEVK